MKPGSDRPVLTDDELRRLEAVARRIAEVEGEVVALYLYGSAARGEAAGDLDVGLVSRGPVSPAFLEAVASRLQQDVAPRGPEIDLRSLADTSPRLRASVLREGRLLAESDRSARLAFESRAMSEWLDFKPTWERMRALLFERWTHG